MTEYGRASGYLMAARLLLTGDLLERADQLLLLVRWAHHQRVFGSESV